MVSVIKISEFPNGGDLDQPDTTTGLQGGSNTNFNNPWTFLASGTTAGRPAITPAIYNRQRFNTDLQSYEFYNSALGQWVTVGDTSSKASAVYPAIAATIANLMANYNNGAAGVAATLTNSSTLAAFAVDGISLTLGQVVLVKNQITTFQNGLYTVTTVGSGAVAWVLTRSIDYDSGTEIQQGDLVVVTLGATQAASTWVQVDDVVNIGIDPIAFSPTSLGGSVVSVSGTANQINSSGGITPILSLSNTINAPGTFTIQGTTSLNAIINDPTLATASATNIATAMAIKTYIDSIATGLNVQGACVAASTVALTVNYANGAAGIGATLTNAGAQVTFTIDGVSPPVNSRVLIKNQASTFQNGIYTVTNVGSGATNWVLTRATDFDQPVEISPGDLVVLSGGTTQGLSSWVQTQTVTTVGTDAILFVQFSASIPVSIPNGGTSVTSVTTTPTATAWAGWDANKNLSANNFLDGYTTTVTSGGTTVLTVASTILQYLTGTQAHTMQAPVTSTLVLGQQFIFMNKSTVAIALNSSGGNLIASVPANTRAIIQVILTSGTTAASWQLIQTNTDYQSSFLFMGS